MSITVIVWVSFVVFVTVMVALDLGVFHRRGHVIQVPEALAWTFVWIALALAFNVAVYFLYAENWLGWDIDPSPLSGWDAAMQFFTGYLVEKSLSVDNIFVIAMIFAYFRVPLEEQHRVLFWGVLAAVVLRGVMIGIGATLIDRFEWIVYVFGGLLFLSAARMLTIRHDTLTPDKNLLLRLARRFYPVTSEFEGGRFFVVRDGRRWATPLFLALLLVEGSDVMFAIDSIPAIFAVTSDPFIVFTSNVFAILGLRSLYFALAGLMDRFRYLKMSLAFILGYVGVKMVLAHHYPIPLPVTLSVLAGILLVGILASIAVTTDTARLVSPLLDDLERLLALSYREARRVVVLVVGATVLLVGILMIALPGPAIIVIPAGLAILGLEFAWARRWLARIRKAAGDVIRWP